MGFFSGFLFFFKKFENYPSKKFWEIFHRPTKKKSFFSQFILRASDTCSIELSFLPIYRAYFLEKKSLLFFFLFFFLERRFM